MTQRRYAPPLCNEPEFNGFLALLTILTRNIQLPTCYATRAHSMAVTSLLVIMFHRKSVFCDNFDKIGPILISLMQFELNYRKSWNKVYYISSKCVLAALPCEM